MSEKTLVFVIYFILILYIGGIVLFVPHALRQSKFNMKDKLFWGILLIGGGPFGAYLYYITFFRSMDQAIIALFNLFKKVRGKG